MDFGKNGTCGDSKENQLMDWAKELPVLAWVLLYLFILGQVCFYAVDVPFADEWDEFPRRPVLPWLFAQHFEHRIVTTRLLIYILWRLNGWNIAQQQVINYLIFGGLVLSIIVVVKKFAPDLPSWVASAFALFSLSPIDMENLTWSFQTQWHLMLLALVWATGLLFDEDQRPSKLASGVFFAICCIYSLASGVPAMLLTLCFFGIFKLARARSGGTRARREWLEFIAVSIPILAAVAMYFHGYSSARPLVAPTSLRYWNFFFLMVASGFGGFGHPWIGVVGTVIYLGPLVLEFILPRPHPRPAFTYPVLCLPACLLFCIATTAAGRSYLDPFAASLSRYTEYTLVAIPLLACAYWAALRCHVRWRPALLCAYWSICFLLYAPHWIELSPSPNPPVAGGFPHIYLLKVHALSALHESYVTGRDCEQCGAPLVTPEMLREADALHLSFMKYVKGQYDPTNDSSGSLSKN